MVAFSTEALRRQHAAIVLLALHPRTRSPMRRFTCSVLWLIHLRRPYTLVPHHLARARRYALWPPRSKSLQHIPWAPRNPEPFMVDPRWPKEML